MIGGRRRYNAQRRRKADERRKRLMEWLARREAESLGQWGSDGLLDWVEENAAFPPGAAAEAARAFGVHRSTISRDIQRIARRSIRANLVTERGEVVCVFERLCSGGPIGRVWNVSGRIITGAESRALLKRIPRYVGWRSHPPIRRAMPI
jgi:hypothetical protein